MNQSNKQSEPILNSGVVDWETFFEDQTTGLIPLIEMAKPTADIRKCVDLIINKLYTRKDDEPHKKNLKTRLNVLIPITVIETSADHQLVPKTDIGEIKKSIIELLREIKEDRVLLALAHVEKKKAEPAVPRERRTTQNNNTQPPVPESAPPESVPPESATSEAVPPESAPKDTETIFADVFCMAIEERLAVLCVDRPPEGDNLPFILSPEFATWFQTNLRLNFTPVLANRFKGLIGRVNELPKDQRMGAIEQEFESKKGRAALWEAWQETWDEIINQTELPKKPKEEKKALFGLMKKTKKCPPGGKYILTLEEWEKEVKRITAANKTAKKNWGYIIDDIGGYQVPEDGDDKLLKQLFGRSASGIKKQIIAIIQIATQGGNLGKAFDDYMGNKNLDLALLAACYQKPELFLTEKAVLKLFLAGLRKSQKQSKFPLTSRYLSDHM